MAVTLTVIKESAVFALVPSKRTVVHCMYFVVHLFSLRDRVELAFALLGALSCVFSISIYPRRMLNIVF